MNYRSIYRCVNLRILQLGIDAGTLWIRVFGWGIHIRDLKQHPPMFSERMGYTRYIDILGYRVKWLRRESWTS